ncbi:unnamed protein product, partial [Cuscuta campestris]
IPFISPSLKPFNLASTSKDDFWVSKSYFNPLLHLDEDVQEKEPDLTPLYCHSDGHTEDRPFDTSEIRPLAMDTSHCSPNSLPFQKFRRSSLPRQTHNMETQSKSSKKVSWQVSASQLPAYSLKLGFPNHLSSNSNKRWMFWDPNQLLFISAEDEDQVSHCLFSLPHSPSSTILISCIYGSHTVVERRNLWRNLQHKSSLSSCWVVGEDFNVISSLKESKGQICPNTQGMDEFNSCIESCNLLCPEPSGGLFTWSGIRSSGKLWRRLDRILVNLSFQSTFSAFEVQHLPRACSNHKALLLSCSVNSDKGPSAFRFLNPWIHHTNFISIVKECWTKMPTVGGRHGLIAKLKGLKSCLKAWNKDEFGHIFDNLKNAEIYATTTQQLYEDNPTKASRVTAREANARLLLASHKEVVYWKQKANAKWLEHGDMNSKVFHAFANGKKRKLAINHIISPTGIGLSDSSQIRDAAITHFSKQFLAPAEPPPLHNLSHLPSLLSDEDNTMLTALPTLEEVKNAIWNLDSNSASGPDGYNGVFFRTTWDIIKEDMLKASQEFFLGFAIPHAFGS